MARPVTKNRSVALTIKFSPNERDLLKKIAKHKGIGLADLIADWAINEDSVTLYHFKEAEEML